MNINLMNLTNIKYNWMDIHLNVKLINEITSMNVIHVARRVK